MATQITLRSVKGAGLTIAEIDANFTALQVTADQALAAGGSGAIIQSGALAASATAAPNASAVQTALSGKTDYGHGHSISVISGAQASLVSGSNIKTVNGYSLLGAGDLAFAGGGGTAATIRIAATTAIPLDTAGNGKAMPLVEGQTISISADYTPTIAAGAILNGVTVADYLSTGTGNLILTNYNARGDTFAAEANRLFTVTYFKQTSGAFAVVQKGDLLVVAPVFTAQSAPAGTVGTAYSYTFVASNATSYGVFSGTVPAGLTLNTATGALTGTPTTAATSAFVVSATNAAGTTNSTAQSVVIGASATAPGQVTALTLGTATSTTQPLTWTAPASNGGSALTDYLIEYKMAASGTYLPFAHTASTVTAIVVNGLTASSSYNYRVSAVNAIGTGTASAVGTGSTAAAAAGSIVVSTVAQTADNLTALGYLDYVSLGNAGNGANDARKAAANFIVGPTLTNISRGGGPGGPAPIYNWTDAAVTAVGSNNDSAKYLLTSTTADGTIDFVVPAGVGVKRARILVCTYFDAAGDSTITLTFTLSDGSYAAQTVTPSKVLNGLTPTYYEVVYNAASASQTMQMRFKAATAGVVGVGGQLFVRVITYGN